MKHLSKTKQEEIRKFERAAKIVHKLRVDLGKFIEKNNVPHDIVSDMFESLLINDINSDDFINGINEMLDYFND